MSYRTIPMIGPPSLGRVPPFLRRRDRSGHMNGRRALVHSGSRAVMSARVQHVPRFMSHGAKRCAPTMGHAGASAALVQVGTTSSNVVAAVDDDAVRI